VSGIQDEIASLDTGSAGQSGSEWQLKATIVGDPTGGWAKATEKTSEAATEAIKAGRDALSFVADPLRELVGMGTDTLKVKRYKRQIRLAEQLKAFLRERGLEAPSRGIPLSFSVPLIEYASLEEDDDLQDIWARMLANTADAKSGTERRTAFINMLKDMTAFDVMILAKIAKISPLIVDRSVYTINFPDGDDQTDSGKRPLELSADVAVSLGNLARVGCINGMSGIGGALMFLRVRLTDLGAAFIASCTTG
jgi:hypothetical protein